MRFVNDNILKTSKLMFQSKVFVEKASCKEKQKPEIRRNKKKCSPVGADGRIDGKLREY